MVPALLLRVDEFPLTQNGKLDEVALINTHRSLDERKVVPPQTPEEKLLAEVWQEVLKKERIGIYDNYFELGGDSILSIAILAKAKERNLKVSLKDIYQYQNIHDLAAIVGKYEQESTTEAEQFLLLSKEDRAKIPADQVEDAYPAGVLQTGMLFHSQWTESKSVYHNVNGYLLEASLNTEHFIRAVSDLVERHPVLRAGFNLSDYSEPLLLISKKVAPPVSFHDISARPESEQQEVYEQWFEEERRNYFDWSSPPLFRINIFKCSPRTFYFTLSEHHAILDGWSVASFITELFHQYMAYEQDMTPVLENTPAPSFRDFIVLEKQAITSDEGLTYWREHLKDFVSTAFPYTPSSNTAPAEYPLKTVDFVIPAEQSLKLSSLAHSLNSHVKNVLLAVHLKVMSLLTNTRDVLTGLVVNGRVEEAGGEKTLGLFLNTLPFRVLMEEGSWADLIRQIIQTEQSHLPHRRVPLSVIKNELGGIELPTLFNFVQFHVYESIRRVSGIKVLQTKFFEMTNFPLVANFSLDTSTQDILVSLRYEASAIDTPTAHRIANYYSNAISSVLNAPYETHEQSLLSAAERRQLLVEWNETGKDFNTSECVHRLFEQQAALSPQAVALDFEGHLLTYAELNARANRLARHLLRLGLPPEGVVGICLERSVELVVAILAVLKAGGAYLPLDPGLPDRRLAYMIEDAGVSLVLTHQQYGHKLPRAVRQIDPASDEWRGHSDDDLPEAPLPEGLAYVIYTSGSTGQPKGVMSEHRGLLNRLLWMQETFCLTPEDRVLQKTPFSFDVSVWEFLWPLMAGARLVVARPGGHKDPHYLLDVIERQGVTTLHFVPSMLEQFLGAAPAGSCGGLRRVICSGEALSKSLQDRFFEKMGGELYNLYGPTEASIDVTWWECQREWVEEYVPIGRPISNTQVYILDGRGEPAPVGVAGELYLGGVGLARGYVGKAGLTAARFVSSPFGKGQRLYRTGDLGRYTGEGVIQYLGRTDHQVKLRGQRIELGEVEHALGGYPGVQSVAVLVKTSAGGQEYLAAYYQAGEGPGVGGKELRSFAQERLPEYMVPSVFVPVEEWPVTSNGKTDRARLKDIEIKPVGLHPSPSAVPRTPTEIELAKLWASLLPVENPGIDDDLFELGGHSLMALELLSKIEERFNLRLQVTQFFEQNTIRQIALTIDKLLALRSDIEGNVSAEEDDGEVIII
jgi:amino acid adenylation domain-containing protein